MTTFLMRWNTFSGYLSWEYTFTALSDALAKAFVCKIMETSPGFQVEATSMVLFKLDESSQGFEFLANFVLEKPKAKAMEAH